MAATGRSLTFSRGNQTLAYSVRGEGTPLLFIHGTGATPGTYAPILDLLAAEYRVFAPDLPGHGASSAPPADWKLHDFADLLADFSASLMEAPPLTVGHSFGGTIAIALAAYRQAVSRVVLVNPAIPPLPTPFWKQAYLFTIKKSIVEVASPRDVPVVRRMGAEFIGNITRQGKSLPGLVKTLQAVFYADDIPYDRVTVPVTVLWGTKDPVFPQSYGEHIANRLPYARIIEIDGHHSWALFHPQLFMEKFREALSTDDASVRNMQ